MRIIFMGTADLACRPLEALCAKSSFEVVAVVTQPDRPKGRDLKLQPSPVKTIALQHNLPVLQPERARDPEFIGRLKELRPEIIVVVAYGQILPQAILDLPRFGCLNLHTSLLPKYRGAAPIQWAILDGESETGVTVMKMDAGLDTGPIVSQASTPIAAEDTSETLHDRLAELGADLLVKTIPGYVAGAIVPRPQPAKGVSYARKLTKEDGHIDWSQPALAIHNRVRAMVPWPGAYAWHLAGNERRLVKIWRARLELERAGEPGMILEANDAGVLVGCGEGSLRALELQREGGRRLPAGEFVRGGSLQLGEKLQ